MDSYALYSNDSVPVIPGPDSSSEPEKPKVKTLVLVRSLTELKKLKLKDFPAEEYETEMWWTTRLQKDKWEDFRPDVNPKKFETVSFGPKFVNPFQLRAQIRKGIPGPLRGDLWPILSGARDLLVPGLYQVKFLRKSRINIFL